MAEMNYIKLSKEYKVTCLNCGADEGNAIDFGETGVGIKAVCQKCLQGTPVVDSTIKN